MQTMKKYFSLFLFFLLPLTVLSGQVNAMLHDQYGSAVCNAEITISPAGENTVLATAESDSAGFFTAELHDPALENSRLLFPYPNPASGESMIPFYLREGGDIRIDIFNVQGRRIRTFKPLSFRAGLHQIKWNGRSDQGHPVPAGIYIVRLKTAYNISSAKLIMLSHTGENVMPSNIDDFSDQHITTHYYDIRIILPDSASAVIRETELSFSDTNFFYINRFVELPFTAKDGFIRVRQNGRYEPLFLKGINLGVALPGTQPGQMAATRDHYRRWIEDLAEAGLNYIRTYTLHYPRFYEELRDYNLEHPDNPLFLLQGVWLDEIYENDLISSQTEKFDADIEEIIDCMHGNRMIGHRYGRAYGDFTSDISPWLLGYIIGREIYPGEVIMLEVLYPDYQDHEGEHLRIHDALPIDTWMTQRLDHLIAHEFNTYHMQRPVSVSSWPTLDPLTHPTEDPERTEEDIASMDLAGIECYNAPAGFFMSYHAYPYYPDFISEDPGYQTYSDEYGPNSYLGYLHDLKAHYGDIPLLIAEYGAPSSWGNAHFSFSGIDHGGHSEREQGENNVRLLKNIHSSGCAGGLLFSWIDEWFKNTWITEPFGSTSDRRPMWQNVTAPEQNYGLVGFKEPGPYFTRWPVSYGNGDLDSLEADMDNAYFYANIHLPEHLPDNDTIWVAFDTYRSDLGESVLLNDSTVSNRAEFLLAVNNSAYSPMFVTEAYDLFGIWHNTSESSQRYHSIATDGAPWNLIRWKNNFYEWSYQEIGKLRTALPGDTLSTLDGVRIENDNVRIRIPWSLLQFTDPSQREVMDDNRNTTLREVAVSDGICLTVIYNNDRIVSGRLLWDAWNSVENVEEYKKASYQIFIDGMRTIPDKPVVSGLSEDN